MIQRLCTVGLNLHSNPSGALQRWERWPDNELPILVSPRLKRTLDHTFVFHMIYRTSLGILSYVSNHCRRIRLEKWEITFGIPDGRRNNLNFTKLVSLLYATFNTSSVENNGKIRHGAYIKQAGRNCEWWVGNWSLYRKNSEGLIGFLRSWSKENFRAWQQGCTSTS